MLEKLLSETGKIALEALTKGILDNRYNAKVAELYSLATRHGALKDRIIVHILYKKRQQQTERQRDKDRDEDNQKAMIYLAGQILLGEKDAEPSPVNPPGGATTLGMGGIKQQNIMNQLGSAYASQYKGIL